MTVCLWSTRSYYRPIGLSAYSPASTARFRVACWFTTSRDVGIVPQVFATFSQRQEVNQFIDRRIRRQPPRNLYACKRNCLRGLPRQTHCSESARWREDGYCSWSGCSVSLLVHAQSRRLRKNIFKLSNLHYITLHRIGPSTTDGD